MKLSVVTTMYCSAPYLCEFYKRSVETAKKITKDYEIIFVNDGSPDESLKIVVDFVEKDKRVKVIDLSRNFGHHKAIMTGLSYAKGDLVFLIDCDLEEEPEWMENFWSELNKDKDVDVVYGVQKKRKGNIWEKVTGYLFYKLYNFFSDVEVPRDIVTARLMKKNYVNTLVSYQEREIFLAGIWADTGFNQKPITVIKGSNSPTTYSFKRKINILINSITSFSSKPLRIIFYTGFFISIFSFIFIVKIGFQKIFGNVGVSGWTSMIASLWLIGGIIIFCVGLLGIYLSKIFIEIKARPYSIIKNIYKR